MTLINDEAVFNDAGTQGDWSATDFDAPVDNDSSSGVAIFREGTVCQEWILKENITTGNTRTSTLGGSKDISNGEIVVFWFFVTSDADLDKLSLFRMRISSDTGFTTNYEEWDAKAQIEGLDFFGWFPVVIYPTNSDGSAGTIVLSSIDSIGWVGTTGGTGTKLTGFDQCHSISYVGGHSQTVTLTNLFDESVTNDWGVVLKFGDFFKFQSNIRLGGGTTANTVFEETNKTLFFDNVQPEHNLGFQFINPSSTGEVHFNLDGWAIFWNEQTGTTPEIFTNPEHCDEFTINNCSFSRGGAFTTRTRINDTVTFVKNTSINNCDRVDPRDLLFEDSSVNDSRITAATSGSLLLDSEGSARWHRLAFTRGGGGHAIVITATGTYTFDTFTYDEFGADDTNTAAVRNESGGAVTIAVSGGDTPTVQNGSGASTTVTNAVTVSIGGVTEHAACKVIADETVGSITAGDVIFEKLADSTGAAEITDFNYEGAFDPSGLDVIVRTRASGLPGAGIADDGGAFTDETTAANSTTIDDMTLLPATPVTGDAYYLGHNEQFGKIKIDISTVGVGGGTITWEYFNGTIYTALSGVVDGTNSFANADENIVSWTIPGDWADDTVNSQGPMRFVRARFSAGSFSTAPKGRKVKLDVTRYLIFTQKRIITSSGLTVVATWVKDAVAQSSF